MELDHQTKTALLQEHRRLKKLNQEVQAETQHPESTILNQSLQEILSHMSQAVTGVLNDLLESTFQWSELRDILTRDDRLVYLGLFVAMMTIIATLLKND